MTSTPSTGRPCARPEPLLPTHRNALRDMPAADRTVPRLLQRQADRYGDKPLVVCGATSWSHREVVERAARMAGALRKRGIEPGDRIAILCGNRLELLETVLGCAWSGAIAVPLNTALRAAGLRHALADSGARVIVVEPELAGGPDGIDLQASLRERWIVGESFPAPEAALPARLGTQGDTLAILYTSGTTGVPQGVCG